MATVSAGTHGLSSGRRQWISWYVNPMLEVWNRNEFIACSVVQTLGIHIAKSNEIQPTESTTTVLKKNKKVKLKLTPL